MKSLPSEYIDLDNPLCLYCKTSCTKKSPSGYSSTSVVILTCDSCLEKVFYPIRGLSLVFTCKNLICSLDFLRNTLSISQLNLVVDEDSAQKSLKNTIPIFDINFSNKEKLNHKLNTYLSFFLI